VLLRDRLRAALRRINENKNLDDVTIIKSVPYLSLFPNCFKVAVPEAFHMSAAPVRDAGQDMKVERGLKKRKNPILTIVFHT